MRARTPEAPPSAELRTRVAKLLGMVGSNSDGEALNAARMADKLVRRAGFTWPDVIDTPATPPPAEPAINVLLDWPVRWQAAARLIADEGAGIVRDKDLAFALVVAGYQHRPTEKQLAYLHDLVRRVLEARP